MWLAESAPFTFLATRESAYVRWHKFTLRVRARARAGQG